MNEKRLTNKQLIKVMLYMAFKTFVLIWAALFIADDLGLLKHD